MLIALLLPMILEARTVWSGSEALSWTAPTNWVAVNTATMGSVSAGDCVVMTYTAESGAQIQFAGNDGSWNTFENRAVAEGSGEARFYLTSAMVAKMTQGLVVSGTKVTLTKIDIIEGDGADYSNSVWIGETVIAKDWSNWQTIDKSMFSSAVENYYIRFKFKDLLAGAQFGLQYNNGSSWVTMPGVSNVAISSLYQQYTISAEMLAALQTYGCIVRGGGYTLTAIDIINPETLQTLTLSVASDETNSNWVYTTASPTIKIGVQNDNGETVTANAVVRLYTDAYAPYKTANESLSVAAGTTETLEVSFSDVAPGFYRVYATVNDEMAHDAFIIGVKPTSIVSAPDKQNDFDSFWQTAKAQLATIEASDTPVMIELNGENGTASKSTAARKVYLVEFKSVPDGLTGEPVTIRGYYCEPTDNTKTYPVIMHYLGYDSAYAPGGTDHKPYCPSGDANPGYAEFYLSTRGQSLNNRASDEREADGRSEAYENTYGDWFAFNFGDKDSYYYRGAYMDCVRALDFMASRATSDMNNLFAEGQSQGGAFTYAAAALSGRSFKAIAPAIPFMGDFPDYFQVGNWPASVAKANQGTMTDEEMYAFLSYFDTKNLATMVNCPVITSIGLQDNVCPPHTNIAPYNNVTANVKKQIVYNPELKHQVNSQWATTYNSFFYQAQDGYFLKDNEEYLNTDEITFQSWKADFTVPTAIAQTLQVGDKITVTVTAKGDNQWAQMNVYTKSENDSRKNQYNVVTLKNGTLYNMGDCPLEITYTIPDETDLTAILEKNSLYLSGTAGVKVTKVKLTRYVDPTTTLNITTVLYEGTTPLSNWSKNYEQPTSIINSLQAGDVLKVIIGNKTEGSTNSQIRIAWGSAAGKYVSETGIHNKTFPYEFSLTLTADQVAAIQSAKALYLNGCNIVVSKWTLTQQKTVSRERGNAATTVWTGSEVVSWNSGAGNNSPLIAASAFANAAADMKVRVNFSSMKLGAQGRIIKSGYGSFDGVSIKKLPTECGDYFEYTITSDMLTELQANGMRINGVGYTATSVELIDPMKEYVISSTFDTDDIIAWEPAQGTPNLTVTLTNYEEQEVTTTVSASLMTDMFQDYNNYSTNVTLAAGETKSVDLEFPDLQPGFYRMAAKANNTMLCTYYIGYNPTAIVSPDDSQPDFWSFWDTWKSRLADIPIDAELTLLDGEESDARNIYEVKYKSVPETVGGEPVYIYGYYAEPKAAGTYPCIIHFHGTDKSGNLTKPSATTTDWCEFRFSARGQTLDKAKNGSVKYRQDPEDESSVDFYAYRLGDNDEHYYRYVYLDTRRAVDFVYSQAKVNKNAIFAVGGSQGGCLTYVCAGLSDGRIKAIAPSITGHADFVHTMEIVGWPTNVFNNWINAAVEAGTYADYAEGKAALLRHQSYFDTKNFASRITCPVITNFSLQDQTDGPHLNISPYNLLTKVAPEDKQYIINQFLGHGTFGGWGDTYMAFFNQYIDKEVVNVSEATYSTYYNSIAVQLPAGVQAATFDNVASTDAQSGSLTINWRYDGDDNEKNVIPGGTAVMLKSTTGNYKLTLLPDNTDAAPAGNLLHGSDVRCMTTGGDKYYKLTYGPAGSEYANRVGWYKGAAGGAAFTIGAHKAWLALSTQQARDITFFSLDDGETTSIYSATSQRLTANSQYYDLQGRRIAQPAKGLYIVNGKKVVIK